MKVLSIDKSNFLKGMSLTEYSGDGGFSPESIGFEVDRTSNIGLLSAGRSLTDYSGTLDSSVVTNVKHKIAGEGGSIKYYLICSNSKIYQTDPLSPGTYSLKDTATGKTFNGNSHAIVYNDELYITSTTDIYKDDFSFTIKDLDWWTNTLGKTALTAGVPHKMFEFGSKLYILNGNKIASWNGSTANESALTLPSGYIITDAEVDNDVVYLTIVKGVNDYAVYTETKIIVWNGLSTAKWLREVPIFSTTITAIKKVDIGFIFFSARNIFYFDGFNYSWIRRISGTPTFNQVVSFNGNVYYVDNGVSCYNARFKIFSTPVYTNSTISTLDIAYFDFIDIFTSNSKMYRAETNNAITQIFYSNWYELGSVYIRKISIGFSSILATNSQYTFRLYDETNNPVVTETISKAIDGAKNVVFRTMNKLVNIAKFTLTFDNAANSKIRYIHIYYESAEHKSGK